MSDYDTQWKEDFSKAYVRAIAAQAGWKVGEWSQDKDLMDTTIETSVAIKNCQGKFLSLKVDLQLKCTHSPVTNNDNFISFSIEKPHIEHIYNRIASDPFYFILVFVPNNKDEWITHRDCDDEGGINTIFKYCGYYYEIEPASAERSPTLRFSKKAMFSASFLDDLKTKFDTFEKIAIYRKQGLDLLSSSSKEKEQ